MMTKADRETYETLRDAVADIDCDLEGARIELAELRQRIADLREDRKWRVEALAYLKAGK